MHPYQGNVYQQGGNPLSQSLGTSINQGYVQQPGYQNIPQGHAYGHSYYGAPQNTLGGQIPQYGQQQPQPATQTVGLQTQLLRPELFQRYQSARHFFDDYFNVRDSAWGSPVETQPRILWTRDDSEYLVFVAEVIVDVPLETAVRWMSDDNFLIKVDTRRKSTNVIRNESPDCQVVHMIMNGNMIVSERDMVAYRFKFYEDPNSFRIFLIPADDVNLPPTSDVVRADLKVQSILLRRTQDNRTILTNYSMLNPKSSMPMFMMRGKVKEMTMVSVDFKNAIEANARSGY